MQLTTAADAPQGRSSVHQDVQTTRKLLEGREGDLNNFSANLMYTLAEHRGPRHRHDFDQVRYAIVGEFVYAEEHVLPKGWVGYFPEGTYYGPQIRPPGLALFYAEFGGASGRGYLSQRQRRAAIEALKCKGSFADGMFSYVDEVGVTRTMHSHQAMNEMARGVSLGIPEPRYNSVIIMNPANFNWVSAPDASGIAHKWLGTFSERGTRIGFVRLAPGAKFDPAVHGAPQVLFLTEGALTCLGQRYPRHSAFGVEPFERPAPIVAAEASELLYIQLPVFQDGPVVMGSAAAR